MNCIYPSVIRNPYNNSDMLVRCRKCTPCRKARASFLSNLCNREYQSCLARGLTSSFVTLTMEEGKISHCGLCKHEYQTFLKRFRIALDRAGFSKVKYIGCGEYGDNYRPHYHFIFFGLPHIAAVRNILRRCWTKGFIQLGPLLPGGINYVVDYVFSDPGSSKDKMYQAYIDSGVHPPFHSRSVGIGDDWLDSVALSATKSVHYKSNGRSLFLPSYFVKKYNLRVDSSEMEEYNYVESYLKNVASQRMANAHGKIHERPVFGSDPSRFLGKSPFMAQCFKI